MSTKTTFLKRIALLAVSALGFSLLSISTSYAAPEVFGDVEITVEDGVITVKAELDEDATDDVYIEVVVSQEDATFDEGLVTNDVEIDGISDVTDVSNVVEEGEDPVIASRSWEFDQISTTGLYSFRVFIDENGDAIFNGEEVFVNVSKIVGASDLEAAPVGSLTSLGLQTAKVGAGAEPDFDLIVSTSKTYIDANPDGAAVLRVTRTPAGSTEGANLKIKVNSSADEDTDTGVYDPAGEPFSDVIRVLDGAKDGSAILGAAGENLELTFDLDGAGTYGSYNVTVFADADDDNRFDSGEISVTFTVISVKHEIGGIEEFESNRKDSMFIRRTAALDAVPGDGEGEVGFQVSLVPNPSTEKARLEAVAANYTKEMREMRKRMRERAGN